MPTPMTVTRSVRDDVAVLTVRGEIDLSNATNLSAALDADPGPTMVDLTGVDYLDSAGLKILLTHAEHITITAPALLLPVLTISGLTELTTVDTADGS